MGQAEVGHHAGAPERHRVNSGQVRRKGKDLLDRGDRLLDVAAAQAGERPHTTADPRRVDAAADYGHGARYLAAENVTFLEAVASDGTAPDHGVDAADADRLSGDQHLPVSGTRVREVDDGQAGL